MSCLTHNSPESPSRAIEYGIKRKRNNCNKTWTKESRSLKGSRLCIGSDGLLRIEGRLNNFAELFEEAKHPSILPCRCALTCLIILSTQVKKLACSTLFFLRGKNSG